jgi:hypothetical protein
MQGDDCGSAPRDSHWRDDRSLSLIQQDTVELSAWRTASFPAADLNPSFDAATKQQIAI